MISRIIVSLLVALSHVALISGAAYAAPDATKPLVSDAAAINVAYTPVCLATRLNNGICYWWAAGDSATHSSATFRVVNRVKVCLDSASLSATVQVKEWIAEGTYSVTPTSAVLDGTDCLWLSKGSYWFEASQSSAVSAVSIREVPNR